MATTIKWIDNNSIETAHRIYKSSTYFTKDNLPAPLVELGADITEYVDSAGADGENWYIVSALLNDYEVFSEPFIVGLSTAYTHDVFGDGSTVATYNFDGDATDLGGATSLSVNPAYTYAVGLADNAIDTTNATTGLSTFSGLDSFGTQSEFTISMWVKIPTIVSNVYILTHGTASSTQNALIKILDNKLTIVGDSLSILQLDKPLTIDVWHHCVVTHKTGETRIILDNTNSITSTSISFSTETPLYFGSWAQEQYYFKGLIDQMRFFNKALTDQEISILYQEGAAFL